ncbi:MAG: dihydroorotase [Bacteroidetes bacterium]|nr:dihydroorotase [Bacteroidota bacterium]
MQVVIKGVKLVSPHQKLSKKADLLIVDGIIQKIGDLSKEELKSSTVYDFEDKYCAPGFYDMHVHLREPGREDKETILTGSNSAAAGGFTGIACMPNTNPAIDSAEVVLLIKAKAAGHLVDVHPVAAATLGRKGESLAPILELHEAGAVGFSDDGVAIKDAGMLRNVLEYSSMVNAPVIEHCEDVSLSHGHMNEGFNSTKLGLPALPSISEDLIVMRDIMMAEYAGGRIHIAHISTKESVEMVRQAKKKGIKVTAEVTPHHFTYTDDALKTYDTNLKMSPPLRTQADVNAIIEGLKDGTIDCIASDHAPHAIEEKEVEFIYAPNGIVGLETQVGLAFSELYHKKHLTIEQIVEKFAINPRTILNLPVPEIKEGEKANLTIFDPDVVWTVDKSKFKSLSKNSPFDKRLLTGKSLATVNNSQICVGSEISKI